MRLVNTVNTSLKKAESELESKQMMFVHLVSPFCHCCSQHRPHGSFLKTPKWNILPNLLQPSHRRRSPRSPWTSWVRVFKLWKRKTQHQTSNPTQKSQNGNPISPVMAIQKTFTKRPHLHLVRPKCDELPSCSWTKFFNSKVISSVLGPKGFQISGWYPAVAV